MWLLFSRGGTRITVSGKRYEKLAATVSRLQREHDRAEGALEDQKRRLKKDDGGEWIGLAEKKLERIKKKVDGAEDEFEEALEKFETDWSGRIKGLGDDS